MSRLISSARVAERNTAAFELYPSRAMQKVGSRDALEFPDDR
jgi:hypothetical protein